VESTVTTHRLVVAEAQHGGCWVGPARRVGCVDGMGLTLHPASKVRCSDERRHPTTNSHGRSSPRWGGESYDVSESRRHPAGFAQHVAADAAARAAGYAVGFAARRARGRSR